MPYKDPEKHKQRNKENRDKDENKEKARLYHAEYRKTPKGLKKSRIGGWKYSGLKESKERMEEIYELWMNTTECDCCKEPITEGKASKVMDHCHKTGKFRNILCHNCNILRCHLDRNYQAYLRMMTL
tara:strand:+ start:1228 stop:1608 length:381 start_codon:yes stop_codon:yes gene_type:complete